MKSTHEPDLIEVGVILGVRHVVVERVAVAEVPEHIPLTGPLVSSLTVPHTEPVRALGVEILCEFREVLPRLRPRHRAVVHFYPTVARVLPVLDIAGVCGVVGTYGRELATRFLVEDRSYLANELRYSPGDVPLPSQIVFGKLT